MADRPSVSTAITELGGGSRLISAPGDLSSVFEIERVLGKLITQLGGLDILVNNAGRGDDCLIDNVTKNMGENVGLESQGGVLYIAGLRARAQAE